MHRAAIVAILALAGSLAAVGCGRGEGPAASEHTATLGVGTFIGDGGDPSDSGDGDTGSIADAG